MATIVSVIYNLAQALIPIWDNMIYLKNYNPELAYTVTLGTTTGYRSIIATAGTTVPGETNTQIFLFAPLASAETAPTRWLLSSGQLSAIDKYNFFTDATMGHSAVREVWEFSFIPIITAILDQWCAASVPDPTVHHIDFAGDRYSSACAVWSITTDGECLSVSRQLLSAIAPSESESPFVIDSTSPNGPVSSTQSASAAGLGPVVEAIQDIARRETVFTFNDSQSIASISSGDVITT